MLENKMSENGKLDKIPDNPYHNLTLTGSGPLTLIDMGGKNWSMVSGCALTSTRFSQLMNIVESPSKSLFLSYSLIFHFCKKKR